MSRIICITGTDTGVGKTFLTTHLLQYLRNRSIRALAMKPFCSGSTEDIDKILAIQGNELPLSLVNQYLFSQPVAPYVAAAELGEQISFSRVLRAVLKASKACDILLVEGAGGALTPITRRKSFADLAAACGAEVIIVGSNKLGVLNHVLLTVEALKRRAVQEVTVVLMEQLRKNLTSSSNLRTLAQHPMKSGVFELPYLPTSPKSSAKKTNGSKKLKKTLAQIVGPDSFTTVVRNAAKSGETKKLKTKKKTLTADAVGSKTAGALSK